MAEAARPRAVSCKHEFASATQRSERRIRGVAARETFPPCKPLKTNKTELESRQILPRSKEADSTTFSQAKRGSNRAFILGVVRGKSAAQRIGGGEIFLSANP
jgi:hypothetical protein